MCSPQRRRVAPRFYTREIVRRKFNILFIFTTEVESHEEALGVLGVSAVK
jgi:hypothetical protein